MAPVSSTKVCSWLGTPSHGSPVVAIVAGMRYLACCGMVPRGLRRPSSQRRTERRYRGCWGDSAVRLGLNYFIPCITRRPRRSSSGAGAKKLPVPVVQGPANLGFQRLCRGNATRGTQGSQSHLDRRLMEKSIHAYHVASGWEASRRDMPPRMAAPSWPRELSGPVPDFGSTGGPAGPGARPGVASIHLLLIVRRRAGRRRVRAGCDPAASKARAGSPGFGSRWRPSGHAYHKHHAWTPTVLVTCTRTRQLSRRDEVRPRAATPSSGWGFGGDG